MSVSINPRRKKRRRLLLVQLLIVIGFMILLWFSFGQNVLSPEKQEGVPEQLGRLELVSSIVGSDALSQINSLHGTNINLVTAYIASYARSNERVTIWVGYAETSDSASELITIMIDGIADGNPVFSNLQQLTVAGHEVFQIEGVGGEHFFYQSEKPRESVVWLSIEAADSMPILEQAVKIF